MIFSSLRRYYLQPRSAKNRPSFTYSTPPGTRLSTDNSLGSLRLQVQYNEDRVFPAVIYEPLRNLLLKSVQDAKVRPFYVLTLTGSILIFLGLDRFYLELFSAHYIECCLFSG